MGKEGEGPYMPAKGPTAQWPSRWSFGDPGMGLGPCLGAGGTRQTVPGPTGTLGLGLCLLFTCSQVTLGAGHCPRLYPR